MSTAVKKPFRLTGWHVLAMMVLFFGSISAVNAVMITLAVKSFPGEQQKKSYMQGLQYNEVLQARDAQDALGWTIFSLDGESLPAHKTEIRLQVMDAAGLPVQGLAISGMIGRPATDRQDRDVSFAEGENGIYTVTISGLEGGNWLLSAQGQAGSGEVLTMEKRLWLE